MEVSKRKMKYFSKRTMCNQMHKHDSKKEANRCDELNLLVKAGIIEKLQQQVRVVLKKKFIFQGVTIRAISYYADFTYYDKESKKFVIEDTKGYRTDIYKIKKKLLLSIMKDRKNFQFLET